ncbi:MAG: hypothetical protein ABJB86_00910 [Bacteroidota bacterium]
MMKEKKLRREIVVTGIKLFDNYLIFEILTWLRKVLGKLGNKMDMNP